MPLQFGVVSPCYINKLSSNTKKKQKSHLANHTLKHKMELRQTIILSPDSNLNFLYGFIEWKIT